MVFGTISCGYLSAGKDYHMNEHKYDSLDLTEEQRIIIGKWIDSITALNGAYTEVVFRMAMQLIFQFLCNWRIGSRKNRALQL